MDEFLHHAAQGRRAHDAHLDTDVSAVGHYVRSLFSHLRLRSRRPHRRIRRAFVRAVRHPRSCDARGRYARGLVNGIYAKNFDGIQIVPTFVLTPLVYLGGVFYSVHILPQWWQMLTYLNPIFYLINGFRYGFLGLADVSLWISFAMLFAMIAVFVAINWYLIRTGLGLKQ